MADTIYFDPHATTSIDYGFSEWTEAQTEPTFREGGMSSHEMVMLIDGNLVSIDAELAEYIRFEASERGVSEATIYREEVEAAKAIAHLSVTEAYLDRAARIGEPPSRYVADDQDCPF